ncbi:sensor histidine kinase [Microbacterium telephonicum]|uniref:Sensor-like histidine kinase SenX3 n=1 Tax=Microbacterium telephonicum TaxID=1714841 RepID=A0A498C4E1_9MICO|nr:ATP-binding protein [Microbacterium telephonicum]RLK47411.1 two-component system sensor histidine kinase SenX3 [Microbacterium telephonicum]
MNGTLLALAILAVGMILGAAVAALVVFAIAARRDARVQSSTTVPEGAQAVLQGMDEVAVVVDNSLSIVAASAPAALFGMQEGGVLPDDHLRHLVREARRVDRTEASNLRLRRGIEPRLVTARASVITPRLTLVVIRDITEAERVEEMRRDFVANTSHELKTPVGAVSLLAEAVASAADDPDQVRHFAARLGAEATRLAQLTSRIMNLSRLQAADDLTDLRDVSVDEVVAAAIESQALAAESAGIEIVRGGSRGSYVRGDVQVLTEALSNLVANAVSYSPAGAQVGVGVKVEDNVVDIAVTDRGIGIPEAEQHRVFERFYRADQARSRRTGGTGLGLSIVKYAVQRHGGEVVLWSRPGRGSTFTVRLPAVEGPEGLDDVKKKRKKRKKPEKTKQSKKKLAGALAPAEPSPAEGAP